MKQKNYATVVASAKSAIACADNGDYGRRTFYRHLSDYAEAGGLIRYDGNRPLYLMQTGSVTADLILAIESYR